jgi:hypothetical protein
MYLKILMTLTNHVFWSLAVILHETEWCNTRNRMRAARDPRTENPSPSAWTSRRDYIHVQFQKLDRCLIAFVWLRRRHSIVCRLLLVTSAWIMPHFKSTFIRGMPFSFRYPFIRSYWMSWRRSQWSRGLRCRSAAARFLGSRVRIPLGRWMFVCYVYMLCWPV